MKPITRAFARLAAVIVIAVLSGQVAISYPAHAWTLGWAAGLVYGWVAHPWIAASIAYRRARKAKG